ncbi:golgin subfamily A member 4-like isoform X1 [Trichoplusia ni]|uniref:Golgin subfamily A member 4-like isoform X1 n=2 Tax=Trichoplusia ni TaxID=7111 RepID=A0A7E5VCV9_TRINI|nr:golgin subfamily A member 4-like isoform X1 [Trichoplusia ni]
MFKKLKDKLAEEVKSSPQRIQQFAQAAQAAVTSASSSISDITNSDLFSIGDNDGQQPRPKAQSSLNSQPNTFQDVALVQPLPSSESLDYMSAHDIHDNQRQRRLSNSSFASDVSFRLPSYETPSMYHLQSDMEVSASEAEERGFSSGAVSLDRVTKEQLYAAYRRTQERYTKYRTQYGDLARHYKLLERENAKARSVLVETQDKALRRISELREQCALEQSAKAHLEKALRIELEEKGMKIEALNTKVQLLQSNTEIVNTTDKNENKTKSTDGDGDVQLINLSTEPEVKSSNEESTASEIIALNNKIEKMEHLLNKYKESLKVSKEKNSQINTELQILSNELENKNREIDQYKLASDQLKAAKENIQELNNLNEELQNKINVYEFSKTRELSTLEVDFQKAQEEIAELRGKIEVFGKREEEYAISLAENKLSIHKELESKETEIKSLKDHLESSKKEIQSLNIVVNDYKNSVTSLEAEKSKLMHESSELASIKAKTTDLESQIEELSKKCQNFEQMKTKADEGYKCLQLQMKQETAEKLAMIDRNTYLENRISQLSEENAKKSAQIGNLESELQKKENILKDHTEQDSKNDELLDELNIWKDKYAKLESEIQEERDELIKLQSEIEKLLSNHELLQTQNIEFRKLVSDLKSENVIMQEKLIRDNKLRTNCLRLSNEIREMKKLINLISSETKSLQAINNEAFFSLTKEINYALHNNSHSEANLNATKLSELKLEIKKLEKEIKSHVEINDQLRKEIDTLQNDKDNLESTISRNDIDIQTVNLELTRTIDLYETSAKELNVVKEENENLLNKVNEFENNFQNLQIALEFEKSQYLESKQKLNELQNEKDVLVEKLKHLEFENNTSNKELDQFKSQHENALEESLALKNENISLKSQIIELNNQIDCINKLQEDNKNLTLENISLKTQAETTANSYKNLETEINDVRKSHAEIVTEKDRLNKTIEELESSLCKDTTNRDSQTDKIEDTMPSNMNNEEVKKVAVLELQETPQRTNNNELSDKYQALKSEYDQLKEENRRFKSDIEGLQTYLTKISKENSVLNDKLRELIATSEHSTESNDISNDIVEFKNEIQAGKDRIDDLLRENMLLVEENLELKDQLQSQNTPSSEVRPSHDNDKEYNIVMEKYNNLLHVNSTLEKRLYDLEQMNKSVNGNMMHIQEKNEKLRLSNEKLERRLDESLVSLRHLHSLQENTELEYLRNILYEYLTGTGTHSVTLAKVLSAIVKFDDMQTKLVLQKEKERQGFLRQLGIIK